MRISQLKASVRNWSLNHLWFVMEHLTKTAILLATCLTVVLSQSLNVCEYRNVSKSLSERHLPSGRHGRREPAGPERFGHGHQGDGRRKIQQRFRWHLGFRSWRSQRQSNRPLHHIHKQKVGVGAFREPFRMELACMELELEHGMVLVVVGQLEQQQRRQRK